MVLGIKFRDHGRLLEDKGKNRIYGAFRSWNRVPYKASHQQRAILCIAQTRTDFALRDPVEQTFPKLQFCQYSALP